MRPSQRSHKLQIFARQKRQIWLVFALIVVAWLCDMWLGHAQILVKSVAAGAFLSYFAQSVFTWLAYRTTGAKARQMIMLNMYLGQIIKWSLTLLGFALIFLTIKPVYALAVFGSYFVVQLSSVLSMWRLGN